jgi:alanyl aminopeptidase
MKRIFSMLLSLILVLGACATGDQAQGEKVADTTSAQEDIEAFDGHKRLPKTAVPERYRISLDIDPAKETFSGTTDIRVELLEETERVDLHGKNLDFERVWANVGKAKFEARVVEGPNGGITMVFAEPLGPGPVDLVFEYEAPLDETPHGLYRVKDGEHWYVFTQFEPLSAREAFPSFDEPRFKTPFDVSITVPAHTESGDDQKAFANTMPKQVNNEGDSVTYHYKQTEPLPTYLVAFAAGPLDVVAAAEEAIPGVPLRVITTKGKSHLAKYALERAPELLEVQTDYFGMKLPFSKLDMVAVPNFFAGAMENVGLVTFRESLLLIDPDNATPSDKYALQSVMAHEFAHMWFGNYVTPQWWNDLWLNEAFATWMATRTMDTVAPEFEPRIDAVKGSLRVMSADALADARAIRQPIRSGAEVMNAFDGIIYTKGRAVLQMLEAWMGEEDFRQGVRDYLSANAYGSGTTDELIAAWEKVEGQLAEDKPAADKSATDKSVADKPVADKPTSGTPISEILGTFLDQVGTPLIEASFECADAGAGASVTVSFEQSRYLPAGSTAKKDQLWKVPVCYRLGADGKEAVEDCVLVDQEQVETTREVDYCPEWMHPNVDEVGYYHWKLPSQQLAALVGEHRDQLSKPERVALLPHAKALVEAHAISFGDYLELVEAMSDEEHRVIVGQIVGALYGIEEAAVDETNRDEFTAWAKKIIEPHAKRLGFAPKEGESAEEGLLRPKVIRAAADLAKNQALRDRASKVANRYLESPKNVPASQAELALSIAAWDGDQALWDRLRDAIDQAPTPSTRVATIRALGSFRNPALAKESLDLLLTDTVRSQDAWTLVGPTLHEPQTREVAWSWLQKNWSALVDKVGEKSAASFPWVGSAFCSEERKQEVAAFFAQEEHQLPGMERNLNQALESIERCVRYRRYVADDAREFLRSQSTSKR